MPETDTVHLMTGHWVRAVSLAVGCTALAAACSGSDQPTVEPPLESAEPITAPPSTNAPAPTTTDGVEPVTSTTTTSTSMAPATSTTTPAPPTTTLEDLRLEIEADLNEGEQAFLEAASDPGSPMAEQLARAYQQGVALDVVLRLLSDYASNGEILEPNPSIPNAIEVIDILDVDGDDAVVKFCRIDAATKLIPGSNGAPDSIVDDRFGRFLTVAELKQRDDVWIITSGDTESLTLGISTCDES